MKEEIHKDTKCFRTIGSQAMLVSDGGTAGDPGVRRDVQLIIPMNVDSRKLEWKSSFVL